MAEIEIPIKKRLRRTWHTFFARSGHLLPVQERAIPEVLAGRNLIVVSPTASGKTEAVVAPLCELILRKQLSGLSVIYLTPTRALANDLFERLCDQMTELRITVDVRTGDRPALNWRKPPDFLITTPESLDSAICRHPAALRSLLAVIVDEIHLIDGTYRGDQVRILLKRLERPFSTYLLSATVRDPAGVASRYMQDYGIISTGEERHPIATTLSSLSEAFEMADEEKLKKLLIFCNSRKNVEMVAREAREIRGEAGVVVHHGSLHRKVREETEMLMKSARRLVCVSTMTLEAGIDIGDVDAVVLADLPPDTVSLVQRAGRAGRRNGHMRVFAICDDETAPVFEEMLDAGISGPADYSPDLSVVVQQIFSMLFGGPCGLIYEEISANFEEFCNPEVLGGRIIPYLVDTGIVQKRGGRLFASEMVMNLGERGEIHSNIPDSRGFLVIESRRNLEIGEIELPEETLGKREPFVLAGRVWEIEEIRKNRIYVRLAGRPAAPAGFGKADKRGAFSEHLPPDLRESLSPPRWGTG